MRKLLFILITIPLIGVAQLSKDKKAEVDSLQQVVKNAKHDTTILNAWLAWEKIVFQTNPEYFFQLNKKIDSLCSLNLKKELNPKEKVSVLRAHGFAWKAFGIINERKSNFEKANECYAKSIIIYKELNDKKQIAACLNNQGNSHWGAGDNDNALKSYSQSLKIREEIGDKNEIAGSLNSIGLIYAASNDYDNALKLFLKSLKIYQENGDKIGISAPLNNLGFIYHQKGNFVKAIEYYYQSKKIKQEIGDKKGETTAICNIGGIYFEQKDYKKAMNHFDESLKISEEIGNKNEIASSLTGKGNIYEDLGNYSDALDHYYQSLKIREEIGNKNGISASLNNIGNVFFEQENYDNALENYSRSVKMSNETGNKREMAESLNNIGNIYMEKGNYYKALQYGKRAKIITDEIGVLVKTKNNAESLWKVYKKNADYKKSLEMFELYITTRDSINSIENQRAVIRQEYQYQYEKKSATDSIMAIEETKIADALLAAEQAENKQHQIEAKKQQEEKYFLFGGLALALIFGGFIFNRFRITAKQKLIIEGQKQKVDEAFDQLEEKNQEILASINYAKRIQSAILPPARIVKEYLKDSFILYKPKDIVAGDFYWLEQRDGKIMFAAADCTGHGVPGAMVSVVCNNGLNRSVREHGLTDPGKILDKTREIVVQEFEKSEEGVQDGMDIALCSLENKKLRYAGAHNPLWIIRKGEVLETKADKQPIGKFRKPQPYTTHTFELEKEDTIYIFSDGYVDQFGGEKEKKFKSKAFKKLLLSIQDKTMEEQKIIIDDTFENWKGQLEQIDDVCVIGVKI